MRQTDAAPVKPFFRLPKAGHDDDDDDDDVCVRV